jgi:hypothetical protein
MQTSVVVTFPELCANIFGGETEELFVLKAKTTVAEYMSFRRNGSEIIFRVQQLLLRDVPTTREVHSVHRNIVSFAPPVLSGPSSPVASSPEDQLHASLPASENLFLLRWSNRESTARQSISSTTATFDHAIINISV